VSPKAITKVTKGTKGTKGIFAMMSLHAVVLMGALVATGIPARAAETDLGIGRRTLVRPGGMEAEAKAASGATTLAFRKAGEERRLLAVEVKAPAAAPEAKALAVTYSLAIEGGEARLAVVAFEKDGAAWFRTAPRPLGAGKGLEARLPLKAFGKAAFSRGGGESLDWAKVEKLWIGAVLDGKASGELGLHRAAMTDEPYRPTAPLALPCTPARRWQVGKDKDATATAADAEEGPGGGACVKIDYAFPGGRHMFVVPTVPVGEAELAGYRALRLTYRATVPEGIAGLLVMLIETGGAQYCVEPAPPASEQWRTLTIPLADLRLGRWTKDANARLDLDDVRSVAVGIHGTATPARNRGTIHVAKIEFIP